MTRTRNNTILALLIIPLMLFGLAHTASASEVTGTLSSDGSTGAEQAASEEARVGGGTVSGQHTTASQGTLQGSVVQGKDDTAAALAQSSMRDLALWVLVPLACIAIGTVAFSLGRRGVA